MKTLGNIIWIIFGGLHIALEYFIAGLILMITIIGIPFGIQSMKLGMLAIWPFGTKVKWKPSQPGCLSIFMNVLWFFVGGIWIWLTHVFYGLIFCITIIGIPFGLQSMKLGMLAIWPFGTKVKWKPSQPGCLSIFMNVLWFFVGGIWIWLTHVFYGLIFCITIIGIPFGKMHFRLAKLALSPFGKELS